MSYSNNVEMEDSQIAKIIFTDTKDIFHNQYVSNDYTYTFNYDFLVLNSMT